MNKVELIGNATADASIKMQNNGSGDRVANFTTAVPRFTRSDDPNAQNADFVRCVAFGKQADWAEKYLRKGTHIALTGHIQTGSYTNKDGQKVYTTDVVVETIEFAGTKPQDQAQAPAYGQAAAPQTPAQGYGYSQTPAQAQSYNAGQPAYNAGQAQQYAGQPAQQGYNAQPQAQPQGQPYYGTAPATAPATGFNQGAYPPAGNAPAANGMNPPTNPADEFMSVPDDGEKLPFD